MTAPQLEKMKFWIIKPSAGRNYVKNPQPYTSTGGYTISGGIRVVDSTNSRRGPGCIKVTPNSGENTILSYSGLTGTSGLAYSFSVDVLGVAGQAMRIYVNIAGVSQEAKTFTATGYWQRISVSFIANTTGAAVLSLQRDSVASTAPFWTDGWQFEQAVNPSTFISGDLGDGYFWEGARRDSASTRMNYVKTGGELLDLDDYCSVASVTGLGHGDWNQILTKMTSGGDLYQGHIRKSRQFSIIVDFIGETLGEIEANRKALIDAIRPDLFEGEMVVRYQGFAANGDEATNPIDIRCVPLPATLTDTPDLPTYQRAVLNFAIPSGLLQGAYEEGKGLDPFAEFPAEYIVKRDPNGNWCKWNGAAYVNPLAGLNGAVYDIKEAPNGDIYVCGNFTNAGGVTEADYLAKWSKVNQAWEAVLDGLGARVRCMEFDGNGDLYIGGDFEFYSSDINKSKVIKITNLNGNPTANALGSYGSWANFITSIAIGSSGYIYIGGDFSVPWGNYITVWNGTGFIEAGGDTLNNIVHAIGFMNNGRLVVGGGFVDGNQAGTAGDYIVYVGGDGKFTEFGTTELNGAVHAIALSPNGRLYIGGQFTNAGGNSKADRAAEWLGYHWSALPAGGLGNTVNKIYCDDNGDIYLAGYFTTAGSLTLTDRVVKSVQGAFQPLDIELPGTAEVKAICKASDGSLYLGGSFSTVAEDPDENAITGKMLNLTVASASANTYPYMQITGPGTLKSIVNYSTGANVSFDGLTLQAGETISLDFDPVNLRFKSGWAGRGSILRYVNAGSDYGNFYLKPGANNISLFMAGTDANSGAWITWTPKFWGIDGALLE